MKLGSIRKRYVVVFCLISALIASFITYSFAGSISNTLTLSAGVYPGGPSYTIYSASGTMFAKDQNGKVDYYDTDFGSLLQACLDALPDEGGEVLVKGSSIVYSFSTTVDFTGHQCFTLRGEGNGFEPGNTILSYTGTANAFEFDTQHDITLTNFLLNSSGASDYGIEMLTCWKVTLDKVSVSGFGSNQFYSTTLWGSRFVDTHFDGNGAADTVYLSTYSFQNLFERCTFYYCESGYAGLRYHGLLGTFITCEFSGGSVLDDYSEGIGLLLEGGADPLDSPFEVIGCNFEGLWDGVGIQINEVHQAVISSCYWNNLQGSGGTDIAINVTELAGSTSSIQVERCNFNSGTVDTTLGHSGSLGYFDLDPWTSTGILTSATDAAKVKTYQITSGSATVASGGYVTYNLQLPVGYSATNIQINPQNATADGEPFTVGAGQYKDNTGFAPHFYWCNGTEVVGSLTIFYMAEYRP